MIRYDSAKMETVFTAAKPFEWRKFIRHGVIGIIILNYLAGCRTQPLQIFRNDARAAPVSYYTTTRKGGKSTPGLSPIWDEEGQKIFIFIIKSTKYFSAIRHIMYVYLDIIINRAPTRRGERKSGMKNVPYLNAR